MDEAQIIAELRTQVAAIRGSVGHDPQVNPSPQSGTPSSSVVSQDDRYAIEKATSDVRAAQSAFAEINPRDPGILNALAQTIKKTIRRLLSWYSRSLQILHASLARAIEIQGKAIIVTADYLSSSAAQLQAQAQLQGQLQAQLQAQLAQVEERRISVETSLQAAVTSLQSEVLQLKSSLPSIIDTRLRVVDERLKQALQLSDSAARDRLIPYVPYFHGLTSVVDLGCGRGEFLELLKEAGTSAYGVDSDPIACEAARAKALQIVEADFFTHLGELPERSLGGVFSSRVVEYLLMNSVGELIALCSRKMKPGGTLVIETAMPNSDSPFGRTFHIDATHFRPVYPQVLKSAVESQGFRDTTIVVLAPQAVDFGAAGENKRSSGTEQLDEEIEHVSPARATSWHLSYAVVARR